MLSELIWYFVALLILFLFIGGPIGLTVSCILYFGLGIDNKKVYFSGLILSGLVSILICRYSIGLLSLSWLDTTLAVLLSFGTYFLVGKMLRRVNTKLG